MADERNNESSSSQQQDNGGETNNNRWAPHGVYVLNYSFTLPSQQGEQQQPQPEGTRMTLPIFGPAGGVFVMNHNGQQTPQQQQGEGPMEGVEFGFEINNPQAAGGQHPFANLFGHTHKPRASERAISKLRELSEDELNEGETTCHICFDKYDLVKREDLRNNDEDDPPVSVPGNNNGRRPEVQEAHVTIENEDPEESVHDDPAESVPHSIQEMNDDPEESVPMEGDEDPETSVPEPSSHPQRQETEDPETSVPEPSSDDPPESVPESGQQSDHRPVELPCGHRFGQSCINEWLGSSNTCPLCRTPLESQDEYLRSTGQEPEGGRFGAGILDFIFQQVPEVFNIIRREVYNNNGTNNNNDDENNDNNDGDNDNNESSTTHNTNNTTGSQPRPFHVHIVRDEDGVYRTHTHRHSNDGPHSQPQQQQQPQPQQQEGSGEQEARHTFISGNTMSELLRAFTTGPPGGENQQGLPFRISRIFNTAINNNRNRDSRHHPYTRTTNNNEDNDNRDLQCASLPLSLCVGDAENEPIIRLDCGHGYHDGCLRMAMRAHGDGHMVDTNDVWCTCCRRYQTIMN